MPHRTPLSALISQRLASNPPLSKAPERPLRARRAAVGTVLGAALTAGSVAWLGVDPMALLAAVGFAAIVATLELFVNNARTATRPGALFPTEAVLAAALMVKPGSWIILGIFIASCVIRVVWRSTPMRTSWIVARNSASASAAVLVALAIPEPPLAALAGTAAAALTRTALNWAQSGPNRGTHAERVTALRSAGHHFALMTAVGMLAGYFIVTDPRWLIACLILLGPVLREYATQGSRQADRELLQGLLAHLRESDDQGPGTAAELTLLGAESIFESPDTRVRVVVFDPDGAWELARDSDGAIQRTSAGRATRESRVVQALGEGPVVVGMSARGSAFTGVLGPLDEPLGVLDVTWPGQPVLARPEKERVARLLVEHAGLWLRTAFDEQRAQRAERDAAAASGEVAALARLGDDARPAVAALRQASEKMAELSGGAPEGTVAGLVDELHRAGAAVATLIGAAQASAVGPTADQRPDAGPYAGLLSSAPHGAGPQMVSLGVIRND